MATVNEVTVQQSKTDIAEAFIGLGSNMLEPLAQLINAYEALGTISGISNLSCSKVYQSVPMGPQDQPDFINAVARCDTTLSPDRLLDKLQLIEHRAGRVKDRRWGPRSLDLDLLLYGERTINTLRLTVPHPGIAERAFVLYPMADLAPELHIPGNGSIDKLLNRCPPDGITLLQSSL